MAIKLGGWMRSISPPTTSSSPSTSARAASSRPSSPSASSCWGALETAADIADPNGRDPRVFAETHDAIEVACDGLVQFIADRITYTSEVTA